MLYTKEIFINKFDLVVNYILGKREVKESFYVQQAIVSAISSLVHSNIGSLILSSFHEIIDILLEWVKLQKGSEDRALGFDTISKIIERVDSSMLKAYVGKIYSAIFEIVINFDQEFPSYILRPLRLLLNKFGKSIEEFVDLMNLVETLLSKGLNSEMIQFLRELAEMKFENISRSILYRLLYTISLTLECNIKWNIEAREPNSIAIDSSLIAFKNNLKLTLKLPRSDIEKALALETLTLFPMPQDMQDLPKFVKEVVLKNLDSENWKIRKAAAKAGSMLWVKPSQYHDEARISEKLMRELVKIFMRVVLSDPSPDTQITMLQSMNIQNKDNLFQFDMYLMSTENLNKLFLCVRDPNCALAELATKIICRLSRKNPSEIVPFLKKLLFQVLWAFIHKYPSTDKIKEANLNILIIIVKYRRDLILPHTLSITRVIKNQMDTSSPNLICHLIRTIGQIAESTDKKIIPYIEDLFPVLLDGLEDKGNKYKRLSSAKTLVILVRSTGFVILPYIKYPFLLDSLASLVKNEPIEEIRIEILGLIGIIGGIDIYISKKILGILNKEFRMTKNKFTFQQLNEIKTLQDFTYMKKHIEETEFSSKTQIHIQTELNEFEEDLFLLGNLKGNQVDENYIPNSYQVEDFIVHNEESIKECEKLLNIPSTISLNKHDFYYKTTIRIILKVIWDESLMAYHLNALQCLHKIIEYLKGRANKFLNLIFPVLSNFMIINSKGNEKYNLNKKIQVLGIFELIFKMCGNLLTVKYISSFTNIFLIYVKEQELVESCLNLLLAMLENTQSRCKGLMEHILLTLNTFLNAKNYKESTTLFEKTSNCLILLSPNLDFHLPFFIPTLISLLELRVNEVQSKNVIWLLTSLILNCQSIVHHISQIIHSLLSLLNKLSGLNSELYKGLQTEIMNSLVIILAKFPLVFSQFLPQINQIIKARKIYHNQFNFFLKKIVSLDNLSDLENEKEAQEIINSFWSRFAPSNINYIEEESILQKKINLDKIKEEFDCSTKSLKEDWNDWLLKSTMVVINQNPNPIIQVCSSLAQIYTPIAYELFNISFASLWKCNLMNDIIKDFINRQFNKCIESSNTPNSVLSTILSLDEFMNHDKDGLHLDSFKMVDLAIRCGAYPKALYYREKELEVLSEDSFESLLYLYNMVGHPESGEGLLNNSSKFWLNSENKEEKMLSYYTKLGKWRYIYDYCRKRELEFGHKELSFNLQELKVQAMHGLNKWEQVSKSCKQLMKDKKGENMQNLATMAADAEFFLGKWDSLDTYLPLMPKEKVFESNYYSTVISLAKSDFEKVNLLIEKSKKSFDTIFGTNLTRSTTESTASLFKLQELAELEELLELKKLEKKYKQESEIEIKSEFVREYERRKENIKDIFIDRSRLSERNLINWQRLLVTRSLQLTVPENIDIYTKLAKLANKNNKYFICSDIMKKLKSFEISNGIKPDSKRKSIIPQKLTLISLEADFNSNVINDLTEFIEKYSSFLEVIDENRLKAKGYLKLSSIVKKQKTPELAKFEIEFVSKAIEADKENEKAWHLYGVYHYELMSTDFKSIPEAFCAFINTVALKGKNTFQDTLRLLGIIFKYGENEEIYNTFMSSYKRIKVETWIDVIPQLSARLQIKNRSRLDIIVRILKHLAHEHPQSLIYVLTVASKSLSSKRVEVANEILEFMKIDNANIVKECLLVSEELNKVSILPTEMWKEGIGETWRNYNSDRNSTYFIKILENLHEWAKKEPESMSDFAFQQYFGNDVIEAEKFLNMFKQTKFEIFFHQAFFKYFKIYREIEVRTGDIIKHINLEYVSMKLLQSKHLNLIIPGLYTTNGKLIKISSFDPKLQVIASKQRPRKLKIYGSDGKEYDFLLKGHEDLRQDERVMQLFSLVNKLMTNNPDLEKKNLKIMKYSIIPLSTNTGMLGWVQNCDTIQQLVKEYREDQGIRPTTENWLLNSMCKNFDILPLINKVEIFRSILENTKGNDLQRVLWLKSPNSEVWLERRTNFTRSLATMSMVGYILGLGDRHPSNIMLQRDTGRIVHIDFGDCWEVDMKREKFPERIPFRLTRMLVKTMDVSSIEGIYRNVCESVMKLLRSNKDSLLAILEAFVYDPLLTWRLLTPSDEEKVNIVEEKPKNLASSLRASLNHVSDLSRRTMLSKPIGNRELDGGKGHDKGNLNVREGVENENMVNEKALEVFERIKQKLNGTDFDASKILTIPDQVNRLIKQATSHENIAAGYIGWCPFW